MITKSGISLPPQPSYRELAKLNMILDLVIRAAAQRGVLRINTLLGTMDFTNTALSRVRDEVLNNKDYWLGVYRQVEIVIKQP